MWRVLKMQTPEESSYEMLRKLVLNRHLNVEERKILGRKQIDSLEVFRIISEVLAGQKSYPPNSHSWKKGEPCGDGYFIEKLENEGYRLHFQRAHQPDFWTLAEKSHIDFSDMNSAVKKYIENEFGKDIDGIGIKYK
jgi:hypothetical protein